VVSPCPLFPSRFVDSSTAVPTTTAAVAPEDDGLIAAARRGDAAAYGTLVLRYQSRLCSSMRRFCDSPADAEDVTQDAFLRAYLKLDTFTCASTFYSWVYRIAVNAAISRYRRQKARSANRHSRSLYDDELDHRSESPDEPLLRQEREAQVKMALAVLSVEHRTILVLREMENCDYDQIAEILAIPVGTVRSRLHRARMQLREKLHLVIEDRANTGDADRCNHAP
jgi:RNA polymerase sigma-70 factor (ECF subfamily)